METPTPTPHLDHKEEFRSLLADYHVSEVGRAMLSQLQFVVLSGIAGTGRNTLIYYLVEHDDYDYIVSDTTRPPKVRDGRLEQDGVQYFFRQEDEVLADVKAGKFLEAELIHEQQVSGTSLRELERSLQQGRTAIVEVEYGGVANIARADPTAHIIGVVPPSFDVWTHRLNKREVMSPQEYRNRITTAEKVLQNMLTESYFSIVVNDDLEVCAADVRAIVAGEFTADKAAYGRAVATSMLEGIQAELVATNNQ